MTETSQVVYHAQCPHCATIRKISHAQLQAAKGLVQCQQCDQTYPARGNLLKPDQIKQLAEQTADTPSATHIAFDFTANPAKADATSATTESLHSDTAALDDIFERLAADARSETKASAPSVDDVASVEDELADAPKKAKSSGLFAKLLSRKNQHQDIEEDDSDVIFETVDKEDGFLNNKAQLHVGADVRPQGVLMEHISAADSEEMVRKYRENKNAAKKRPVNETTTSGSEADALLAVLKDLVESQPDQTQQTVKAKAPSGILAEQVNTINHADDFVFQMQEEVDDNITQAPTDKASVKTSNHSKLQTLLVREQTEERANIPLTEADVIAPDYDANKAWFTQFFNSLNQNQGMSILGQTEADNDTVTLDENGEPIPAAKRMHETGSNTVAMRLPENSMLVFTLEDGGTSHSQLSFIDIQEHLPHKHPEPSHTTTIVQQSHHNEHTVWTVACILAILVLIIQMFYYFLLLTP